MLNRARPFLRIGAVASSLILLSGFVAYRSGLTSPRQFGESGVTPPLSTAPHDLNSIESTGSESQVHIDPVAGDQFGTLGPITEDVRIEIIAAAEAKIQRDALTLMSSSKSIVMLPIGPVETQKAVDQFRARAQHFFLQNDRNHDGKLTRLELDGQIWKKLEKEGAIENGSISREGVLKHFLLIAGQIALRK